MLADPSSKLATFGAVFAALYAAHQVADHWVQSQWQADTKGQPGWLGRLACAAHVATYTLTAVIALATVAAWSGWRPAPWHAAIGLTVSAVSHYIADRRSPLRALAGWLGKSRAWLDHGGGMYALDQAWHGGFLFVAALWIAGGAS